MAASPSDTKQKDENSYCIYASVPPEIQEIVNKAHDESKKTPELLYSLWWETPHVTIVYGIKSPIKIYAQNLNLEHVGQVTNNILKDKSLIDIGNDACTGTVQMKIREKFIILCLTVESPLLNAITKEFRKQKRGTFNFTCNEFHVTIGVFKNTLEGVTKALEIANQYRSQVEEKIISLPSLQFVDNDDHIADIHVFKKTSGVAQ
jgi:hypothetical protein